MGAIELLTKAIEYDIGGRKMEAMKLYADGIGELMIICKAETNAVKKQHLQTKIAEYMERAETLRSYIKQWTSRGEIKDRYHIMDGVTGYGYDRIFSKYLGDSIREITVEESYLREFFQLTNLVRLCELFVTNCRNLKYIKVVTSRDPRPSSEQLVAFGNLKDSLALKKINFDYELHEKIHDRQIIFNNGYIIKIGRGIDYFKGTNNKFSLGAYDYNFRECKETNVDVLYCPSNRT